MNDPTDPVSDPVRVLVVEDGEEYIQNLRRFLPERFELARAGSGPEALSMLAERPAQVIFLDMRFDRTPRELLLGEIEEIADRFNGDLDRALRFIEDNQGAYVLAALRDAGWRLPVVFSHDFTDEPRRWANLERRYAPLDYLPDNAGPDEVSERLGSWAVRSAAR
jgi:CheY-like chemotaxis protein